MEQNLSWEADSHSASQEIPRPFYGTRRLISVFTWSRSIPRSCV